MLTRLFSAALSLAVAFGAMFFIPLYIYSLGLTQGYAGIIWGSMGIMTVLSALSTAWLAKRLGLKFSFLLASFVIFVGYLLFSVPSTTETWRFIVAAAFVGAGWGTYYNVSSMSVAKLSSAKSRPVMFGYLSMLNVLGASVTPLLIKFFFGEAVDYSKLFYGAAIMALIAGSIFYYMPSIKFESVHDRPAHASTQVWWKTPAMIPVVMVFFQGCTFAVLINFQTYFAETMHQNYASFFLIYSLMVVLSRLTMPFWVQLFSLTTLSVLMVSLILTSLLLYIAMCDSAIMYVVATVIFGFSYGLLYPILQSLALAFSEDIHHPKVITVFSLAILGGSFIFPLLAGILIQIYGIMHMLFVLCAFLVVALGLNVYLCKMNNLLTRRLT